MGGVPPRGDQVAEEGLVEIGVSVGFPEGWVGGIGGIMDAV